MIAVGTLTASIGARAAGVPPASVTWLFAFAALTVLLLRLSGAYRPRLRIQVLDDLRTVLATTALAAMVVVTVRALITDDPHLVGQTVRQFVFIAAYLCAGRASLSLVQATARRWGHGAKRTLIVGAGRVGHLTARRLREHPDVGLRPVGFLDKEPLLAWDVGDSAELPVLGASWDLEQVIEEHGIEHVVVTFSTAPHHVLLSLVERCERLGVEVTQVPRLFEQVTGRIRIEHLGALPLLAIDRADPRGWQFAVKYAVDRIGAAFLLVVLSPVLLGIAGAVRLTMGSPVLFRQVRVGRDGREFVMLKFRSMRPAAEPNDVDDARRVTGVGAFLRRTSLDELPQLVNVAKGDMSFIGPRPEQRHLVTTFSSEVHRYGHRHRVKSGVTGWAQIHGLGRGGDRFSPDSLADRVEWDNYYIENWSLWLDFKILLLTARAVLLYRQ
jgi:exopolysaccharide biosynthesis polyprenyl glycosylphosphotransferase